MSFTITPELFKVAAPTCKSPELFIDPLNEYLPRFYIDTYLEIGHFLAQYSYETGDFNKLVENTNYTTPERLVAVFPKYFYLNTVTSRKYDAKEYAGHADKIANIVYANRYGNGNTESGDGFKFRGRGLCHLTFKDNYSAFKKDMGQYFKDDILEKPEQLEDPINAIFAGIWFWDKNNINKDATNNSVEAVTRKINGGTNGLADRKAKTDKIFTYIKGMKNV